MKRFAIIAAILVAPVLCAQETYVQLPPNSTGAKLRMRCNTISANLVCSQGFFIDDGSGSNPLGLVGNPIFTTFTNATLAITASSLPLPTGAATETGNLATIVTNTGRIPSSPATDRTTAAAPFATELSDGAAFYTGTKTGQLPAALDGSGFLKTHEQGTANVAGSVTANIGTTNGVALDATLTGGTQTTRITDGTNTATVKAASTAAAATDKAVVVAVSPNNSVAVTGTFFQGTQPVSGTVTANIGSSGSLALDASVTGLQVAQASTTSGQKGGLALGAVTTGAPTYTTAQSSPLSLTASGALRTDGSAATQPVSCTNCSGTVTVAGTVTTTPPANASTNVAQIAGTTADTNSGVKSAGTLRVVLATDQPQLSNKLLVTPDANSAVNVSQFGGSNVVTGTGAGGAGIPRVTVSSDSAVTQGTAAASTAAWPVSYGTVTAVTATWTSATTSNTAISIATAGYSTVIVSNNPTTITGGVLTPEVSDDGGTTWYAVMALSTTAAATPVQTIGPTVAGMFTVNVSGLTNFRLRLSTVLTGAGSDIVRLSVSATPRDSTAAVTSISQALPSGAARIGKVLITDDLQTAVVKGASTAAAATDAAIVVAVSPNNSVTVKTDQTTHGTTDLVAGDITKIGGTTVVSAGVAGALAVGGIGATNTAITENPQLGAIEAQSGQPAAATTGNKRQMLGSLDGALYIRPNGPVLWNCGLTAIAATLTQCQAAPAAGLKLYVTDIQVGSNTATGGSFLVRYGTGSNCGTGTTTLFPNIAAQTTGVMPYPPNTASLANINFTSPPAAAAANAVCVICVATNTCVINMTGYTAP